MAVGVFLSNVHQDVPTTCVVGSLREIATRQYQATARKKTASVMSHGVWLKASSCLCLLVGTQTIAFTALLKARRKVITQSSSKRTAS